MSESEELKNNPYKYNPEDKNLGFIKGETKIIGIQFTLKDGTTMFTPTKEYEESLKYYTPEIGEFHVGFEFEYRIKGVAFRSTYKIDNRAFDINQGEYSDWFKESDFSNVFCDYDSDSVGNLEYAITKDEIRVKYLDKEDIESLGWGFKDQTFSFNHYFKENFRLTNSGDLVEIYKVLDLDQQHQILFLGSIKNKSELIKLMKQLGISQLE